MPIDSVSSDLREWASTSVRLETKLWIVRKHAELGNPSNVVYEIPEEYRPVLDTKEMEESTARGSIAIYDVSIQDLMKGGLLAPGSRLFMSYKPKSTQERKTYEIVIEDDGSLRADDQRFSSPSYAAMYYINKAGSPRKTVNGWTSWKTEDRRSLADLRDRYLREESNMVDQKAVSP
jgi:hypothetical protein